MTEQKKTERKRDGVIIVIEGPDGVGKTTVAAALKKRLSVNLQFRTLSLSEPLGAPIFGGSRELLRDFVADPRCCLQHESKVSLLLIGILEQIHFINSIRYDYDFIIMDRFRESVEAYQCYGLGFSLDRLALLEQISLPPIDIDFTCILDADYKTASGRLCGKARDKDYYENPGEDFYNRVRAGYINGSRYSRRRKVIDTNNTSIDNIVLKII